MDITFHPIGTVRNRYLYPEKPQSWYGIESSIELEPRWTPALCGLTEFSHILVLCYLDRSPLEAPPMLIHPRRDPTMPLIGFWSTRTPHRPNPISVTMVRLIEICDHVLRVQNLDMFDGTPVLDIKPYLLPRDDQITMPQWVYDLNKP